MSRRHQRCQHHSYSHNTPIKYTLHEQNKRKNRITYGELLNRIYGNRAVDGALQSGPPNNNRYQHNDSKSKPYVTYPNDPHNYYTLNGTSRLSRGPGSSVTSQGR
ncbi:putative type II restriction enzyme [Trichinella spiralis]|uniref:Type II restriction enzyme n=1 Tax=Trichinella spiralis TaxID=6334 RepID=A0ABR3KMQ9_TRISP